MCLPDPDNNLLKELDKLLFDFLWSGKRAKIKKTVVFKPLEEGGLNMVNIYVFLSTLKIDWMRKVVCGDSCLKRFKGNHVVKKVFVQSNVIPSAVSKWNSISESNMNWKLIFFKPFQSTVDVSLRWFQLRLLHRILPCNKYLYLCKIKNSPLCTFCGYHEETIVHLFWECMIVKTFWIKLNTVLHKECLHCEHLTFSKGLIIFGNDDNVNTDNVLDLIILLGKYYIYKCKLQGSVPLLSGFLKILKQRYYIEKKLNFIRNRNVEFLSEWLPYANIC
ncbi:uncharacterized protein [Littorina saxatilis]|uniref:uncharacterized protein n=1 Tax=Littorina saxatilis TaxID=31220 RepID=UPI0038B5A740